MLCTHDHTHLFLISSVVNAGKKYDVILISLLTEIFSTLSENINSMATKRCHFLAMDILMVQCTCDMCNPMTFLGGEGHAMSLVPTASGTRMELWYDACSWE